MGNEDLITDILTIVAGATADVPERLISDIDDLSSSSLAAARLVKSDRSYDSY